MTEQTVVALPATPDSVYAGWTADERAAVDRLEARYNAELRCQLGELVHTQYARVAPDASLTRLAVVYRRQLEDIGRGDLAGGAERARLVRVKLRDINREREMRAVLAESWLAAESGTHCYTAFMARGGLTAVAGHGAPPPTYHLARILDRVNQERGLPHVLWQ